MNQQNSTFGNLTSLRIGSMLLYSNNCKPFGDLLHGARSAQVKADILVNVIQRMKFLQDSHAYFQNFDQDQFFSAAPQSTSISARDLKKLYIFIEDVYASPIKRKDCCEMLINHVNNYAEKHLHNKGYLPRYVCDDFDEFCKKNQYTTYKQKLNGIEEYTTKFGYKSGLRAAFQRFFLLNFTKESEFEKLKSLVSTITSSFTNFFNDIDILKLQKQIDTHPVQVIYSIYGQDSISDDNHEKLVELFLDPEVDELISIVQKIQKAYSTEDDIAREKISMCINKAAIPFKTVRNIEDIKDDTAIEVFLLMTQNIWNGSYHFNTVEEFASGAGKKIISTKVKDPNNKSIELIENNGEKNPQEGEGEVAEKALDDTMNGLVIPEVKSSKGDDNEEEEESKTEESIEPVDIDDAEITGFEISDKRDVFDTYYAKILKPYQEKYKERRKTKLNKPNNIHVAMLYLEHRGKYPTIIKEAYGEEKENKQTNDRARHAKESGKKRIIKETPTMYYEEIKQKIKTIDLFTEVEIYASKLNNDNK